MAHRAGLSGKSAAGDGGVDVKLGEAGRSFKRLAQQHLQHGTGEIGHIFLAVDDHLAGAGLHPDAGDGVFALAGRVGAALRVELLHMHGRGNDCAVWRGGEGFE